MFQSTDDDKLVMKNDTKHGIRHQHHACFELLIKTRMTLSKAHVSI